MSEEVESTQSRPPVQKARRQRPSTSKEHQGDRQRKRPPQSARRPQRAQQASGAPAGAKGRPVQGKGRPTQGKGGRPAHESPKGKKPLTVPLVPMILVTIVCVVAAVLITRFVVTKRLETVQTAATTAEVQVEGLVKEVDQKDSKTSSRSSSSTGASGVDQGEESSGTDGKQSDNTKTTSSSTDAGVEDPWLTSGTFTTGDAQLDEEVKAFCDSYADTSMELDDAALEVYKGIAWSEYVERDDAQHPAGKDWRIEYARKYYEHDCSGNCYEFAAFLMYCMQYLGFDDALAEGVLIELQSGGWGDHGIVYVTNTNGEKCLCDTSRGTDGWMLSEGSYNVQIQDFENA